MTCEGVRICCNNSTEDIEAPTEEGVKFSNYHFTYISLKPIILMIKRMTNRLLRSLKN